MSQKPATRSLFPENVSQQLRDLGFSPEEITEQFVELDLSLDEVVKKTAAIGVPSIYLVVVLTNFWSAPFIKTFATSLTSTIAVISDSFTGYAIEIILVLFYLERLKTESLEDLCEEIDILPLTDTLRAKIKSRLNQEKMPQIERKVTIVRD